MKHRWAFLPVLGLLLTACTGGGAIETTTAEPATPFTSTTNTTTLGWASQFPTIIPMTWSSAVGDALPRLAPGAVLRPWLQAFWWTNSQIRSSIQTAEDGGVVWILWNARSNFDLAALSDENEVED